VLGSLVFFYLRSLEIGVHGLLNSSEERLQLKAVCQATLKALANCWAFPGSGAGYYNERVSFSPCISHKPHRATEPHQILCMLPGCGHGPVPLCWRCNTSYASGFVDDIKFSYDELYGAVTLPQQPHCSDVYGLTRLTTAAPRLNESFVQGFPGVACMRCILALSAMFCTVQP